ncbi:MAG: hypothetical protein WAK84_07320 [Candidatus Cybelea sp.]|jgi:hypothetical protein
MHRFFLAALLAALPIAAVAMTTLTPSTVVGAPATYDGQTIMVAGTVQNIKTKNTEAMGQITVFELCDTKCIHVFDKTNQTRSSGSSATVTGMFHASFKTPTKTRKNVLIIGG